MKESAEARCAEVLMAYKAISREHPIVSGLLSV